MFSSLKIANDRQFFFYHFVVVPHSQKLLSRPKSVACCRDCTERKHKKWKLSIEKDVYFLFSSWGAVKYITIYIYLRMHWFLYENKQIPTKPYYYSFSGKLYLVINFLYTDLGDYYIRAFMKFLIIIHAKQWTVLQQCRRSFRCLFFLMLIKQCFGFF